MSTILNSLKKSSDKRYKTNDSTIPFGSEDTKKRSPLSYLVLLMFLSLFTVACYFILNSYMVDQPASERSATPNIEQRSDQNEPEQTPSMVKLNRPNAGDVKQALNQPRPKESLKPEIDSKNDVDEGPVVSLNAKIERETQLEERKQRSLTRQEERESSNVQKTDRENAIKKLSEKVDTRSALVEVNPESKNQNSDDEIIEQKYILVHQLPFSIRKDLPRFKLNVHIYDANPENRVAIINGVRFYIDDYIEETVLVKDIVQYGVLLEVEGQEFLVPR